MVSVIGISEMQDWLQGTFENENTTAGLILADNTAELLILADTGSMGNASQYYVRFCDKQMTEAHIKQKDSQTGLTILAVSKDEIYSTTMEEIRIAELGISGDDAIVGQPVIAIGARAKNFLEGNGSVQWFQSVEEAMDAIKAAFAADTAMLVKASHSMHFETIVEELTKA